MNIIECDQRSEEWHRHRLGKWTASFFDSAITKTGKEPASAKSVNNRLIAELVMGMPDTSFESSAMERGRDLEDQAFEYLDFTKSLQFSHCGFVDSGFGYGCSPDGINFDRGYGLEMKCPLAHTHIEYLVSRDLPQKYYAQVQGSMLVTGLDRWYFFSFHPDFPSLLVEVKRDEIFVESLHGILVKNCELVKEGFDKIQKMIN